LIQARWPTQGERDRAVEADVEAILDVVRGIRNARADAKIEPATWLPVDLYVPPRLGETFSALRPAVERLARAKPLRRHLTPEELRIAVDEGGLTVIAGEAEAIVGQGPDVVAEAGLDRARLDRELAQAEALLDSARDRLANEAFLEKAPAAVVEGARAREAELADQVERLRDRLSR
jgi:valyl-tRNA synthetase